MRLPVSGAIDRNRCGRDRGEAAATEEAYDEGDRPPIPHRVEKALLWSIRESPPIPKAANRSRPNGRGRDEDCSSPRAQIPPCAANAPGSATIGVGPQLRAQPPIGSTWQLGAESEPLFPLGEALPSTASAGCRHPLFGRFLGSMASSEFSSRACSACG